MKTLVKHLASVTAVVALSASAYATPTLTINDGVNLPIVVTDNGVGDFNPLIGVVDWSGQVGVWTINLDSGTTKPVLGSALSPVMDLFFKAISGGGAGDLWITFSEDGFTAAGGVIDLIGGTTAGTVTDWVYKNGVGLVTSVGPLGPGVYAGTASGSVALGAGDTLGVVVKIHHDGNGITTGDKYVAVAVPDGGVTLLLLGTALAGLSILRKRVMA